jgi:adenosine deaminase
MNSRAPRIDHAVDRGWLARLPKVELHVHLEGAVPLRVLWELLQKYGDDSDVLTPEHLQRKFVYRDFPHFIDTWTWMIGLLRQYEDFELLAEEVARDFARQNIRYSEVFYSPPDFLAAGLEPQPLTEAIRRGLSRVPDVEIALVADLVRDYGAKRADRMLACISEVKNLGVIGVGIGGREYKFPPAEFCEVYEQARELGFKTSAHAGEAAGPESIWGAIEALQVDRIGHGTRAIEDARLVDYLAQQKLPLELCVLSNVRTAVVNNVTRHPARIYYERGIPVSINTDDPTLFGNSLVDEYLALHEQLGFSRAEITRLIEQGIETSWLDAERKQKMLAEFCAEFAAIDAQCHSQAPTDL